MIRRRRAALGLLPVIARVRRFNFGDTDISDHKPALYAAWVNVGVATDGERPRWDQIRVRLTTIGLLVCKGMKRLIYHP